MKYFTWVQRIFRLVEVIILIQFDKDGSTEGLDEDERKELFEDLIKTKAVDAISGFFGDVYE